MLFKAWAIWKHSGQPKLSLIRWEIMWKEILEQSMMVKLLGGGGHQHKHWRWNMQEDRKLVSSEMLTNIYVCTIGHMMPWILSIIHSSLCWLTICRIWGTLPHCWKARVIRQDKLWTCKAGKGRTKPLIIYPLLLLKSLRLYRVNH